VAKAQAPHRKRLQRRPCHHPPQVEDRVAEAAELLSMLEELRPTNAATFNAFAEVWRRIARIPPAARPRLLHEIQPGAHEA